MKEKKLNEIDFYGRFVLMEKDRIPTKNPDKKTQTHDIKDIN